MANKARRKKTVTDAPKPFVSVHKKKVKIRIGKETRKFEPTYLGGEDAAKFLATTDVTLGAMCSSTVDFPEDGGLRGFNAHEWLAAAMARAFQIAELRRLGITFEAAPSAG